MTTTDNNKYNEILFFKVFNNIYIRKIIFKHVQTIEWCSYKQHEDLHIDNRLKFRDIHSLSWMINNNQHPLLKDKIKSNKYIYIDKEAIKSLLIKDDTASNEITRLLLSHSKRNEYGILQLNDNSNNDNNNNIYRDKDILEFIIQFGNPTILKELLSNFEFATQSEDYVSRLLHIAYKNTTHNEMVLKLICETSNSAPISKKMKYDKQFTEYYKFDFSTFITLESPVVKNKLLDLNMVLPPMAQYEFYSNIGTKLPIENQTFESLLVQFRIHCIYNLDGTIPIDLQIKIDDIIKNYQHLNDESGKLKELHKLILKSCNYPLLYKNYLLKFDESLNEYHQSNFGIFQGNLDETNKFISLYRYKSLVGSVFGDITNEYLVSAMKICNSGIEWNPILKQIETFSNNGNDLILIDSKDTIDWCLSNNLVKKWYCSNIGKVSFSTLELSLYSKIKSGMSEFQSLILKSFESESNDISFKITHSLNQIANLLPSLDKCTIEQLHKLNQNFNDSKYEHAGYIEDLFKAIDKLLNTSTTDIGNLIFKFEYAPIKIQVLDYFSKLIHKEFNFKMIKFIIENTTFLSTLNQLDNLKIPFTMNRNHVLKAKEIISSIHLVLSKYKEFISPTPRKRILNHLFRLLFKSNCHDSITDQIKSTYSVLIDSKINVKHSLDQVRLYLSKRSLELAKYFFTIGQCFLKTKQILPLDEFTIDYIFNSSFDDILNKLISSISSKKLIEFGKVPEFHITQPYHLTNLLNLELGCFLDIKRIDLFFNRLQFIVDQFNSMEPSNNSLFPQLAYSDSIGQLSNYSVSFIYSRTLLTKCCKIMTLEQINQLIQFNSNVYYFYQFILFESICIGRLDIINFILGNIENVLFPFDIFKLLQKYNQNNPLQVLHLFLNNQEYSNKFIKPFIDIDRSGVNPLFKFRFSNYLVEHYKHDEIIESLEQIKPFNPLYTDLEKKYSNSFLLKQNNIKTIDGCEEFNQILSFNYCTAGLNKAQIKSNTIDEKLSKLFKLQSTRDKINDTLAKNTKIDIKIDISNCLLGDVSTILNDDIDICKSFLLNYYKSTTQ